jgi:general stress protein 26
MTEQNHLCRVWDLIEKIGVCMLTTRFAGGLRARPFEARVDRDAGHIVFVTDLHSAKHDEIDAAPDVGLVLIDPAFEFAKARLTGEEPKLGENRKVTVKM